LAHPNARLTPHGRLQIVKHREDGYTQAAIAQAAIAEMMGVSRATVSKWLRRHAREGAARLADRSSRPRQIARGLSAGLAAAICISRGTIARGDRVASATHWVLLGPRSTRCSGAPACTGWPGSIAPRAR
jgi:transposase-like protein